MNDGETSPLPVTIRPQAVEDIERHAIYLEENADPVTAQRFRTAMKDAVDQLTFVPGVGAPHKTSNTLLSLRMYVVPDFRNYLVFYHTPEGNIEIVRVFHGAQDIQSALEDEEETH